MTFKILSEEEKKEKEEKEMKNSEKEKLREETAGFTGHRPDKLLEGSYDYNHPRAKLLMKKLIVVLEKLILEEGITTFISGGALGFDQIAFICVNYLKKKYPHIKNILAIPFKNQPANWKNPKTLELYGKLIRNADEIFYVDEIEKYQVKGDKPVGEYSPIKMQKRNEFMVDKSRVFVSAYDGTKGGTQNCVKYALKNGLSLYNLRPQDDFELEILYGLLH